MQITLDELFSVYNIRPIVRCRMSYEEDDEGRVVLHWPEEMEKTCQMPRMKRSYPCPRALRKESLFCELHHSIVKTKGIEMLKYCDSCGKRTHSFTGYCNGCGGIGIRSKLRSVKSSICTTQPKKAKRKDV